MASNSLYGNQYSGVEIVQFQWFVFQSSLTAPATPTGGSWNFQTNVGTPPSGWSNAPPASPSNEVWVSIAIVSSLSPTTFTWSTPGLWYQQGAAGQVSVGTTSTLSAGSPATVSNSGTTYNAVLNFGIPQGIQGATGSTGPTGPTGPTGSAATVAVGTTTTLASGTPATVTNSGSSSAATFNFGIPQGIPGNAATIAVGTTTTTAPGTSATVTNSGTSGSAVFNFGIPKGAGVQAGGTTGQALIKNSNTDYDTTWTTITGTLSYQGSWNASTNTPTLTSSVGTNGYYYIVSVAGTTNLNGITDWQPNDWAIFNGSFWEKIDNTDLVTSVNGYTGAVTLTNTDVGAPTYTGTGASGTWGINVTGNAGTVTNGVYTTGSYSNPSWLTALAGSKVTAIPNSSLTNSSLTIGSTNIALGGTSTSLAGISQITWSGSSSGTSSIQASPVASGAISILPNVAGILVNTGGTGVVSNTMLANSSITINGTPISLGGSTSVGTVTSVSGTAPIVSSGGNTPAISITQASSSTNGYLSSTDWTTFNNKGSGSVTSVSGTGTVNGITLTGTVTSSGSLTLGGTLGSIANSQLSNSTISGVSLGSNLNALTIGSGLSGTSYNGSTAVTIANTSPMVYPGAGIPNSTGSAWGTSYGTNVANGVAVFDANKNLTVNCLFEGFTTQAASGSTITLLPSSVQNWLITGSGGQTIKLPDATTLPNGSLFTFNNNQSSGTIVIQNNSSTTIATVQSGGYIEVILQSNSIAAGTWDYHNLPPSNVAWSTNTLSWAGSYTNGTWNGNAVGILYGGTGATTASGALTNLGASPVAGSTSLTTLGTVTTGVWNATPITNTYLANSSITFGATPYALGSTISSINGVGIGGGTF